MQSRQPRSHDRAHEVPHRLKVQASTGLERSFRCPRRHLCAAPVTLHPARRLAEGCRHRPMKPIAGRLSDDRKSCDIAAHQGSQETTDILRQFKADGFGWPARPTAPRRDPYRASPGLQGDIELDLQTCARVETFGRYFFGAWPAQVALHTQTDAGHPSRRAAPSEPADLDSASRRQDRHRH